MLSASFFFLMMSATLCAQTPALPADIDPESYSRLPLIKRNQLDANGQRVFDLVNGKDAPPRLGPPAASMHSLGLAEPMDALNQNLRKTVVGPHFFELCTLIAARDHDQQYEWSAHEPAAQRAGVDQAVIDAVKYNRDVTGLPEKDATVILFGRALLREHKASPQLYGKVVELFGRQGMIEIAGTIGDYVMTAIILNAVDQQLPPTRKALLPVK
jgi:4-carboxymuconolactone decarboxylase